MGDARFDRPLARVREATDRNSTIQALKDYEVIEALAAASREKDPYLANVLATEAVNRNDRKTAIVESAEQGLLTVDPRGRILYANPAAERLIGHASGRLVGRSLDDTLVGADAVGERLEVNATLARGGSGGTRAGWIVRSDGARLRAEWSIAPILRDGTPQAFAVAFADVTRRHETQRELDQERLLHTMVLDAQRELKQGVLVLESGLVRYANDALVDIVGAPAQRIRTEDDLIELVVEDERQAVRGLLVKLRSSPRQSARLEVNLRQEAGGTRTIDLAAQWAGAPSALVLVLRDITIQRVLADSTRVSERAFRATFERAAIGLGLLDLEGRWLRANEATCDALDRTVDHLRGRPLTDVFAPSVHDDIAALLAACRRDPDDPPRMNAPLRQGGGWAEFRLSLVHGEDGQPAGMAIVLERKERTTLGARTREAQHA